MDLTSIRRTKGSRQVQTTTIRMETKADKVDLTAIFHTGSTGI